MANDEWLRPATLVEETNPAAWNAGPPRAPAPAFYDLRPLSMGEILDRTFTLYRSRFWLFAGLATLSGAVYMLVQIVALVVQHAVRVRAGVQVGVFAGLAGNYVAATVFSLVSALTLAASTWALAEIYLGRDASVTTSMRATLPKWWRYLLITLWQGVCLAGPILLGIIPGAIIAATMRSAAGAATGGVLMIVCMLAGLPVGVWLYLRNAMAVPACVFEQLKIRDALRRSRFLTRGVKWQLIVLGLIVLALFMVVAALESPFSWTILRNPTGEHIAAQAGLLVINLLGHILVAPVATIGLTLFYFDQRVRREGFDLLVLLGQGSLPPVPAAWAPPPPATSFVVPDFGTAQPQPPYANPYTAAPPAWGAPGPGYAPPQTPAYQPPSKVDYGGFPPAAPPRPPERAPDPEGASRHDDPAAH